VIALDLRQFKAINDSLGRNAGDELLKQVAQRMVSTGGDVTRLARIGGDLFASVKVEQGNEQQLARHTDQRLNDLFDSPYRIFGDEVRVGAHCGVSTYPADGADAETLLRNAETALKRAKSSGERYTFYAKEMTARVAGNLALENQLRQAIDNDEFVLHYQPKIDIETRSITGVEALIRWQRPGHGLVPPGDFIPLLEETGLILQVGEWALRRAARDHRRWAELKLKAPRVAVNVSQIQLRKPDFIKVIERAVIDGTTPPGIDLEITESLFMDDLQNSILKLKAARNLGVHIAIDDFGTGYSSLTVLATLPVEILKIDRSFVVSMLDHPDSMTLVQTIISLAHSLRLKVVAEGVDSEEQAKILRLLRCDEMQGFLFSKPVPFDAITALLHDPASATAAPGRRDAGS
jgi:diguanylate cyclase (GGDEF)-like protein